MGLCRHSAPAISVVVRAGREPGTPVLLAQPRPLHPAGHPVNVGPPTGERGRRYRSTQPPASLGTLVVVLIWINGPFGGGKTATAFELKRRLPESVVCDPEHLGFGLHRMLPAAMRADFQDLQIWRSGVREILDMIARTHDGPVIVPMTLIDPGYFTQIVGRLRDDGHDLHRLTRPANLLSALRSAGSATRKNQASDHQGVVDRLDYCRIGENRSPAASWPDR
jgi:hypothetical protein